MGLHNRSQIFTGPHENVPESLIIPDTRAKTLLLHRTPWASPLPLPSALTQLWWGTHPSSPALYPVSFCLSVLPEGRTGLPCTCLSSIPNPCVPVPPHLAAGSGTGMYCRSFTSHQTHSFRIYPTQENASKLSTSHSRMPLKAEKLTFAL